MPLKVPLAALRYPVLYSKKLHNLDRSSHLAVTCGNGCWCRACPQVKRPAATVLGGGLPGVAGGACGPVGVGDGQGQGLELGDQGAEPAVVGEPLPEVPGPGGYAGCCCHVTRSNSLPSGSANVVWRTAATPGGSA